MHGQTPRSSHPPLLCKPSPLRAPNSQFESRSGTRPIFHQPRPIVWGERVDWDSFRNNLDRKLRLVDLEASLLCPRSTLGPWLADPRARAGARGAAPRSARRGARSDPRPTDAARCAELRCRKDRLNTADELRSDEGHADLGRMDGRTRIGAERGASRRSSVEISQDDGGRSSARQAAIGGAPEDGQPVRCRCDQCSADTIGPLPVSCCEAGVRLRREIELPLLVRTSSHQPHMRVYTASCVCVSTSPTMTKPRFTPPGLIRERMVDLRKVSSVQVQITTTGASSRMTSSRRSNMTNSVSSMTLWSAADTTRRVVTSRETTAIRWGKGACW